MTILIGFLSGVISGFGIGGGAVLIPALAFFAGTNQHVAQTVNLFYFIPTAAAALVIHIKNKNVCVKEALIIAGCGVIAAGIAAWFAARTEDALLRTCFGVFLLIVGVMELFHRTKKTDSKS